MSESAPGPFDGCASSFQSVSSIGGFALFVLVLEAIAIPGMKNAGTFAPVVLGLTLGYAMFGLVVGGLGRRACRRAPAGGTSMLRVLAVLALVHVPFGTVAGLRTLWVLARTGPASSVAAAGK